MSFVDKVVTANRFDLAGFLPVRIAGRTLGWTDERFARLLAEWVDTFAVSAQQVRLVDRLDQPECDVALRTHEVDVVMRELLARGEIRHWRDEPYSVHRRYGEAPAMLIERAALAHFGFAGCGVHMNGIVRGPGSRLRMWVARRSLDKPTWPGMLDQLVAGGQPAALSVPDNLVKECWEEAAIPERLARTARPVGTLTYVHGIGRTIRPDTVFCYDLELPENFVPRANDGEVESFELLDVEDVARLVRDTDDFKFNCALVVVDFLVRWGVIGPRDSDYVAVCDGLRAGAAARYFDS